jgi:hypothetical protein
LLDRIAWSRRHGYGIFEIDDDVIALGRLFAYAFRTQTVGALRAARLLLERLPTSHDRGRAIEALRGLEELSLTPVPTDFRAVISTVGAYERGVRMAQAALDDELAVTPAPAVALVRERLLANLERVTAGNGLWAASDLALPEQGTFKVPGITVVVVPLVYGDYHSWNSALVVAGSIGQTTHRHRQGVEIHLGYSPLVGRTLLGDRATPLDEGYAMPIPPLVDHGFDNLSADDHLVPFIFGSRRLGGWGIFADVEPRPRPAESFADAPLESVAMNHSVYLERAIERAAGWSRPRRQILIPVERTATAATGGLVLALRRVDPAGTELTGPHYRILSIRRGRGRLRLGPVECELGPHDHIGLPADLPARLTPLGAEPLIQLEATLEPAPSTTPALRRRQARSAGG